MQNKVDKAYKSIRFFHGNEYDVYVQFDRIYNNISKPSNQNTFRQVNKLLGKYVRKHFISLMLLMLLLQFTGYAAILSYTTQIFEASKVTLNMYTSTVLTSIGMLMGAIIYTALVDYVGRL